MIFFTGSIHLQTIVLDKKKNTKPRFTTNMKSKRIIIQIIMALCTVFSSCKKDVLETSEVPNTGPYASLQDFYQQRGVGEQTFTITNPEIFNMIVGGAGTKI